MAAICNKRFVRLSGLRNLSLAVWKMIQMTTRPRMTGSEPRSVKARRWRRAAIGPVVPESVVTRRGSFSIVLMESVLHLTRGWDDSIGGRLHGLGAVRCGGE